MRIVWLFEELGLPYELERFSLGDPALRSPQFRRISPVGRVPALQDGDTVLFESGAILQYVLAKYGNGRLVPSLEAPEFATYLQWLHFAEGMIMPPINTIAVETLFLTAEQRNQTNIDRASKLLGRMLAAVEEGLSGRDYLAGGFSGADIMTGHACLFATRFGVSLGSTPNVEAYVDRLNARPALQRALAV